MKHLEKVLSEFVDLLENAKKDKKISSYALIGALAIAARGRPRATEDIGFLVSAKKRFFTETFPLLAQSLKYSIVVTPGSADDPIRGLVGVYDKNQEDALIDILPVFWKWQDDIVKGAEYLKIPGTRSVPVARTEDLVVLKLKAGGPQDVLDAKELLKVAHLRGNIDRNRLFGLAKRARVDKPLLRLLSKINIVF